MRLRHVEIAVGEAAAVQPHDRWPPRWRRRVRFVVPHADAAMPARHDGVDDPRRHETRIPIGEVKQQARVHLVNLGRRAPAPSLPSGFLTIIVRKVYHWGERRCATWDRRRAGGSSKAIGGP